jgi:hypothetical protein
MKDNILRAYCIILIISSVNNNLNAQINIDSLISIDQIQKNTPLDTLTYHYCNIYKKAIQQELTNKDLVDLEKLLLNQYIVEYNSVKNIYDTIALYNNHQRTLLFLITENYNEIIKDITNKQNSFYKFKKGSFIGSDKWNKNYKFKTRYWLTDMQLIDSLELYLIENLDFYKNSIEHSNLTKDEQEFLKLYLLAAGYNGNYCDYSDTILNESFRFINSASDLFLSEYVEKNLYLNYKPTKWSYAGAILGTGVNIYTGELSEYFKPSVYIPLYLWIDFAYDKIYFSSSFTGAIGTKMKKEALHDDNIWPKDSSNFQLIGDLTLGYSIIDNNKLRISPFLGIMIDSHVKNFETEEDSYNNITNNQFVTVGLMVDKPFEKISCIPTIIGHKSRYINYVRFKFGYLIPNFELDNKTVNGGMFYFQCCMLMRSFGQKRIKQ